MLPYIVLGIFLTMTALFIALSFASRKPPMLGLLNGQLRSCPATPNCVCSEHPGEAAFVEPLVYSVDIDGAWRRVKQAIVETGGVILTEQGGYLHARYETPFMRYIDDVELRIDEDNWIIHIHSASRVGRFDMGANRTRVNRIREVFDKQSV